MTSLSYRIMAGAVRIAGMKRIFRLPEEKMVRVFRWFNRNRTFRVPKDNKAIYGDHVVLEKYHCLTIQTEKTRKKNVILFFFGGGFCLGPDSGDVKVAVNLAKQTDSDVCFPYYPLCPDHSIREAYEMSYACYKDLVELYGASHISLVGFSSGAALAIGTALHNNAMGRQVPMPRQIIASSPGCVPMNEKEFEAMLALNDRDILIDATYMKTVRSLMEHGEQVPDYMLSGLKGNFTGLPIIRFYYGGDEVLRAEAENFMQACENAQTPYTMTIEPGMCHCYCFQTRFPEGRKAYREIIQRLKGEGD